MIDPRIKFRHLQTFVEVARQKGVMRAAERLHVTQPAVTKTLRELEDILGVPLLEREGRGVKLTSHGDVFLKHAGAAISALRQAVDSVGPGHASAMQPVRIGALPTVSVRIMPKAMRRFLEAGPGGPVKVVTGENAVLLEQLRAGELDVVIGRLAQPDKMTGFSFEHLYSEQVRFIVRPGHPLTQKQADIFARLGDYPVLMPTRQSVIRPFVDQFFIAHGMAPPPLQIETVSDSFGRAYLRENEAIWIISEGVVADDLALGTLVMLPVETGDTRGPVGLTIRADRLPSAPLALLMQSIRTTVAELQVG